MTEEIIRNLLQSPKSLPSKFFYDRCGSELFEKITQLNEYYLTDTEISILKGNLASITEAIGEKAVLVEPGSGSSKKTRLLLDHLRNPVAYVPVEISEEYLTDVATDLQREYPSLLIKPVHADYTHAFELPPIERDYQRLVIFYPGSTIGNFDPEDARTFLKSLSTILEPGGGLLIGVDLQKDKGVLERAYNDDKGITAAFNKNILVRLNREVGTDFDPEAFRHIAFYNEEKNRIEMHLESLREQTVHLNDHRFHFRKGETIHTENSYKYSLESFQRLVKDIYRVEQVWTDDRQYFSLQFLAKK